MDIINNISIFALMTSILYVLYVILKFIIILYGRMYLENDAVFKMETNGLIILWISLAYIFTFILI